MKLVSGVDESKVEEVLDLFKKSETERREEKKEKEKVWKSVFKMLRAWCCFFLYSYYFVHCVVC